MWDPMLVDETLFETWRVVMGEPPCAKNKQTNSYAEYESVQAKMKYCHFHTAGGSVIHQQ